ncbi:MAG TPA: DUF3025 domain-containing protein [Noviherbaspirillum sp.]|uniref:DUF3025 domain-containing protein n=1 Tax=Noviherbaspirillum sp. TaxID=1926288 RepID=UPI002B481053|nr:DUF3025 domain-containing protein [Noviherbaspirillum sp.]HJV84845.1 DUF3025 domain-containing protein [Noviherbaspirillum sp.]
MSAAFLHEIDWRRPWLAPYAETGALLTQVADWRVQLNALATVHKLCNHRGLPIRFVPQAELPSGVAYEAFISDTGRVPTRENLHDFFNALVWLSLPATKMRLNALQASMLAKADVGPTRGKLRDFATIFDENAAIFVTRDASLNDLLRRHRWKELFLGRRDTFWRECEVWLFGHALVEKLVCPFKAITTHAFPLIADASYFSWHPVDKRHWLDQAVSKSLSDQLTTVDFTPLPVLGVPGWWEGQDAGFYADSNVFRPMRNSRDASA